MGLRTTQHDNLFNGRPGPVTSLMSFPVRGPWGSARYRGNCSGYVLRRLLALHHPTLVVDPAEGSGTSREVCHELGVEYVGLDLYDGFDVVEMPLIDRVPRPAELVFFHPPYWNIIRYSGAVWGTQPDPRDLSQTSTCREFLDRLRRSLVNCLDAIAPGGRLVVLIGDVREHGMYYSPQADIIGWRLAPLERVWIKVQHHCRSDTVEYPGAEMLVRIRHEYLVVLRKPEVALDG